MLEQNNLDIGKSWWFLVFLVQRYIQNQKCLQLFSALRKKYNCS